MLKKSFSVILIIFSTIAAARAQAMRYTPDGKTLAVNLPVSFGKSKLINQVLFFDAATGKMRVNANVSDIEFDQGAMLFTGNGQTLMIADISETRQIKLTADNKADDQRFDSELEDYDQPLVAIAQSTDGKTFYKLYSDKLTAYNFLTQTVKPEEGKKTAETKKETDKSEFIAIHPNGKILVEYRKKDAEHSLVVHDQAAKTLKTIELPYSFEVNELIEFSAIISENGETLALKCDKTGNSQITFWNLKTGASLGEFSFPEMEIEEVSGFFPINNVAVSPDGKKVAVKIDEMFEDENDKVVLWDIIGKKTTIVEAKRYSEEYFAKNIVFSPDSKTLAVSSEVLLPNSFTAKIQLFDAVTGKFIREF